MLSDEELEARLIDTESDTAERTSSKRDTDKFAEAICAFANDLADRRVPGVLFIGANDDGSCAGLEIDDEFLRSLTDFRSDGRILPPPVMAVSKKRLGGCELAVVEVAPSHNPLVKFKGRTHIRVGPRRGTATAEEEKRLVEKRRLQNLPFDQQPVPGACLEDLDRLLFREEYLPSAVPADILEENGRDEIEQMKALRLLDRTGVPTPTAILVTGKDPQQWFPGAYIQFVRYNGGDVTDDIRDMAKVDGRLREKLEQIDRVMAAHNMIGLNTSASRHAEIPDYPPQALTEIVRNAVIHRTYEASRAPVRVNWFNDRIEISNPGGPFGQVSKENFGTPGITDYRNPGVAEAARNLGFAQRFGRGLALARRRLRENGNPDLEVQIENDYVLVTLRPSQR